MEFVTLERRYRALVTRIEQVDAELTELQQQLEALSAVRQHVADRLAALLARSQAEREGTGHYARLDELNQLVAVLVRR